MAEIVRLDDTVYVTGQIAPADIAAIAANGIKLIVNNRPDGEAPVGQPTAAELELEAGRHDIRFVNIQFPTAQIAPGHTVKLAEILKTEQEPMLIFCRTGTRSTMLWAAAQLALGNSFLEVFEKAVRAGYDLRHAAPMIEQLGKLAQAEL
ncbi:MAG: TIGR01244 family phosphatase [Hyphomicrobiales bacterium]|nr:TIGR01244 family phosphatase [Hyphomicrobiales bacterium]